jgi:hypothetical protein
MVNVNKSAATAHTDKYSELSPVAQGLRVMMGREYNTIISFPSLKDDMLSKKIKQTTLCYSENVIVLPLHT